VFLSAISFYVFAGWHYSDRVVLKTDGHTMVPMFNASLDDPLLLATLSNRKDTPSRLAALSSIPSNPPYTSPSSPLSHDSQQQSQLLHPLGCRQHPPIHVFGFGENNTLVNMELKMRAGPCGSLRRNWTSNPPLSPLARQILQHQSNCSLPVLTWKMTYNNGIGSNMAFWSMVMCYAWEHDMRLRSYNPNWIWLDQTLCDAQQAKRSPWLCYFPTMEYLCDHNNSHNGDEQLQQQRQQENEEEDPLLGLNVVTAKQAQDCSQEDIKGFVPEFRAATIEYMFRSVSPLVIQEAQRQLGLVFGPNGAPNDLITVHVRWGDKKTEMKLVAIDKYIQAVWELLLDETEELAYDRRHGSNFTHANIYLATEDPLAAEAFIQAAPKTWNIFTDVSVEELTPFRPPSSYPHLSSIMAKNTRGRGGLIHMGSLLVGMEANYFVLSTQSTFGRVMDAIRTNILDPRCGNCTRLVDVQPGLWWKIYPKSRRRKKPIGRY
jgi:hypothetical protein